MAQRRKRRTKAEIETEKEVKAAAAAEAEKMESDGFEKVRNRDDKGHYVKDDPSTPENEAWDWVKKDEEEELEKAVELNFGSSYEKEIDKIIEEEPVAVVEETVEPEPVKVEKAEVPSAPVLSYSGVTDVEHIGCRFKRKRAIRRQGG
jgi:hypothetical protein